jgi:hypothetical protein
LETEEPAMLGNGSVNTLYVICSEGKAGDKFFTELLVLLKYTEFVIW